MLPPALFFASLDYFLPKTSSNLSGYLGELEDRYFPVVSEKHEIAKAHASMTWERAKAATQGGREKFEASLGGIVDKVQQATGLKISEALGRGEAIGKRITGQVLEVAVDAEKRIEQATKRE